MIDIIWVVVWLVIVVAIAGAAIAIPAGRSTSAERPPFPTNPAERASLPTSSAVAALDRNIRTWLDRDDIETWIATARAAGLQVPDLPAMRSVPLANPISQEDGS